MRALQLPLSLVIVIGVTGCGSDFQVPAPPDTRIDLDLGVEITPTPPDMDCFNTACGGCSSWANFDGSPSKVGDPCLYKGVYQCMGTSLVCSSAACLACSTGGTMPVGTVCGADGHTIVELTYSGATCSAYDFGSAIGVCNHGESDKCLAHCTGPDSNHQFHCAAVCASDDGGGTGCAHSASEMCETLSSGC